MKSLFSRNTALLVTLVCSLCFGGWVISQQPSQGVTKVLLIDGQNNHAWVETTPVLKAILEQSQRCQVTVSTSPGGPPKAPKKVTPANPENDAKNMAAIQEWEAAVAAHKSNSAAAWEKWRPVFSDYDVIVSNYNGELWPEAVRQDFEAYVSGGGGFVPVHAANNSFPEWPAYNAMIGLGGWGGRSELSGPYLRLREGKWVADPTAGRGGAHGERHSFLVVTQAPEHPIMAGLPTEWKHAVDELYDSLRGPAVNVEVLGAAFSDKATRGSGEMEPLLMTIQHGKGRVFHTALGHDVTAMSDVGFQETLKRGVQWAATGKVTFPPVSGDELSAAEVSVRAVKVAE